VAQEIVGGDLRDFAELNCRFVLTKKYNKRNRQTKPPEYLRIKIVVEPRIIIVRKRQRSVRFFYLVFDRNTQEIKGL